MSKAKTATIRLYSIKDPDVWPDLIIKLGLTEEQRAAYFDCAEYADLELEIDSELLVLGGRILPRRKA